MLHIRPNLLENQPRLDVPPAKSWCIKVLMYQETKAQGPENAGVRMSSYSEDLTSAALAYHRLPRPGKLEIQAIKPLANQRDLALAPE